jgi:hypothetical protein
MKIHLKDTTRKPEDYKQSPHIFKALIDGTYAACNAGYCGEKNITENIDEVTCKACNLLLVNK